VGLAEHVSRDFRGEGRVFDCSPVTGTEEVKPRADRRIRALQCAHATRAGKVVGTAHEQKGEVEIGELQHALDIPSERIGPQHETGARRSLLVNEGPGIQRQRSPVRETPREILLRAQCDNIDECLIIVTDECSGGFLKRAAGKHGSKTLGFDRYVFVVERLPQRFSAHVERVGNQAIKGQHNGNHTVPAS
jgi:hypothetical protein